MPCILKDAHGGGWKEVYVCRSLEELLHHYDHSGLLTMIVQEFIQWEQFVRCLCLGQQEILPMPYDPRERRYLVQEGYLSPALEARIVKDARTLVRALGYDMNSIEFAVRDGVPYAIDFMNPAPDMDINSLTPDLLRLGGQGDGRHGDPAGERAAAPGGRPQVGRRLHRQSLRLAPPCRTRSPTTTSC